MNEIQDRYVKARTALFEALKEKKHIDDVPNEIVNEYMDAENKLTRWATRLFLKRNRCTEEEFRKRTMGTAWMLEIREEGELQ